MTEKRTTPFLIVAYFWTPIAGDYRTIVQAFKTTVTFLALVAVLEGSAASFARMRIFGTALLVMNAVLGELIREIWQGNSKTYSDSKIEGDAS
jgi:hypothetical protein